MCTMLRATVLIVIVAGVYGQDGLGGLFALPNAQHYANKPTVPPDLQQYFDLEGSARTFVDSLIGPRPGGLFPEKNFEVSAGGGSQPSGGNFFSGNPGPQYQLPPGFQQGFSLVRGGNGGAGVRRSQAKFTDELEEGSGTSPDVKSSIDGIPNVFPNLPKAPIPAPSQSQVQPRVVAGSAPQIPKLSGRPEVPEGGLGPLASNGIQPSEESALPSPHPIPDDAQYGALTSQPTSQGGLIGSLLGMIGLNGNAASANPQAAAAPTFSGSKLGSAISSLFGGRLAGLTGLGRGAAAASPQVAGEGNNVISNVLYNALTSGSLQSNDTDDANGTLVLTNEQKQAIGENIALIQQLITQPSSPFCNPKPTPVQSFNVNAFMGQWYQVLYSPPLSPGPCSMVAYKKLADVANGGPGTVFDTFEYTTEGTPFGRPRISSGYAIIRAPGELIYRTTNSQNDVNVHVIGTGPINAAGEYEYVIMSVNCNYPLHVFARDPVTYKQTYEAQVNSLLEQKGLTNGFSRLLNIVAPVDSTLCNFPPTLFNIQG